LTPRIAVLILGKEADAPMTIEIHQPELEALIQQRLALGGFHDVEEVLLHALRSAPLPSASPTIAPTGTGEEMELSRKRSLEEVFAMVRGLADDLDFSRDKSASRRVDLS
jgi:hypothetical protein